MKVCVLNGSPKGKYSITIQTILYLQKVFKEDDFEIYNVSSKINYYKKDLSEVVEGIKSSDLILFSYPVYTFIAPSQLHLFINLLKKQKIDLSNKFVTQITTSKHFYDFTAHNYVEDNCFDLKLKVIHGLSLDMDDLLSKKGQNDAINFFKFVKYCCNNNIYEQRDELRYSNKDYVKSLDNVEKSDKYDTVIVTDLNDDDFNLKMMIEDFQNIYPFNTRIVNIAKYPFSGGCLGCFSCASDGKCIYKDKFDEYLRNNIQSADAVVYAFTIVDHSMGPRFKMYDDRQFCNGHRTVTEGKPFAYIVNGDITVESNLLTIINGRSEVGHNFLCGIANNAIDISKTSSRLVFALENHYLQPRNFLGVGGMKIFRDLIWIMRGIMKADHKFYKKHGIYDFPQKSRGRMIKMCLLGSLLRNKKIKEKMGNKMNEGMIMPYKKIIENVKE